MSKAKLRQPWWFAECKCIEDYMPPYPQSNTKPTFVVKHTPSNMFLRYSKGPQQGHFWDLYGDDYHDEKLARLAISQAPPPPKVVATPGVKEIEAWRLKLRQQQAEIKELRQQIEYHNETIKYLRGQLGDVLATVRHGYSGNEDNKR